MSDNKIHMVARWGKQRRPMPIHIYADTSEILQSIIDVFELEKNNTLSEYQIQFYDNKHETFIDLYSLTSNLFQQVLIKLSSADAPPPTSKEWFLNIVPKTATTKRHRANDSIADDTYSYQQENEPTSLSGEYCPLPTIANTSDSGERTPTDTDSPIDLSSTPLFAIDGQSISNVNISPLELVNRQIIISELHPYVLKFLYDLRSSQRSQFESDLVRKTTTSKSNVSGVLLRSVHRLPIALHDEGYYPIVHFQIPPEQLHLKWYMYIYILTEADADGQHYLHASKGIFDNCTKDPAKFGRIVDTSLVNPFTLEMSQEDLRDGSYTIRIKVCNIKNLPSRKRDCLREFPKLNGYLICDDEQLLTRHTSEGLQFSNDSYHVGCILVHENISRDQCISNLTIAEKNRKRRDTEPSNQRNEEYSAKNFKADS